MPHEKDQTHWHEPTGTRKAGFGEFKKQPTPYDAFMESEGIPVFRGIGIRKVQDLPLARWKRTGGRGHYIQLHGTETKWGCYVVEVPPAGALNPEKHMYEEIFLVVEGRGTTEVWQEGDARRHVFEWQKGSMFSIPMNAWHRLVNATSGGALLLAGTTAPNVLNMINNVDAVFDNPFAFRLTAWFGPHNPGRDPGAPGEKHTDYTAIDIPDGGTSIPYWMEDPYIRREYEETLKKNGVPNRMEPGWYVAPATK